MGWNPIWTCDGRNRKACLAWQRSGQQIAMWIYHAFVLAKRYLGSLLSQVLGSSGARFNWGYVVECGPRRLCRFITVSFCRCGSWINPLLCFGHVNSIRAFEAMILENVGIKGWIRAGMGHSFDLVLHGGLWKPGRGTERERETVEDDALHDDGSQCSQSYIVRC